MKCLERIPHIEKQKKRIRFSFHFCEKYISILKGKCNFYSKNVCQNVEYMYLIQKHKASLLPNTVQLVFSISYTAINKITILKYKYDLHNGTTCPFHVMHTCNESLKFISGYVISACY